MSDLKPLTVDAAALRGMLTDLERTAGRDRTFPYLRAILLFTTPDEPGRLYGTSTDRNVLGQAWEPCEAELGWCLISLEAVKTLSALLTQAETGAEAALFVDRGLDGAPHSEALELHVKHVGSVSVVASPDVALWPRLGSILKGNSALAGGSEVHLGAALLDKLTAVARRRREPLHFNLASKLSPVTIGVGNNYRALLMPVNHPHQAEEFRFAVPPEGP